ncbi:hypothetical protein D3C71_1278190 [compost metagenome]
MQAGGGLPRVAVDERRQHAAHVLAEAGDALAVDQPTHGAAVGLREAQVVLEGLVLRAVAGGVEAEGIAEQLQRLRRHAGEHLEGLLGEHALADAGLAELLAHTRRHRVGLACSLEQAEVLALTGRVHCIDGEAPKARQRRVAAGL